MRTPANRFGDREEPVAAAIFLASESASFVTGTILPVDDGFLVSGVNQETFRNAPRRGADQA
jgi:NAD(P)-dependent dehydrogenase (short-subunit alcohol dehydrogenase family)